MFKVRNIPLMFVFRGALRIVRAVSLKEISGKPSGRRTAGYFHPVFNVITRHERRKSR